MLKARRPEFPVTIPTHASQRCRLMLRAASCKAYLMQSVPHESQQQVLPIDWVLCILGGSMAPRRSNQLLIHPDLSRLHITAPSYTPKRGRLRDVSIREHHRLVRRHQGPTFHYQKQQLSHAYTPQETAADAYRERTTHVAAYRLSLLTNHQIMDLRYSNLASSCVASFVLNHRLWDNNGRKRPTKDGEGKEPLAVMVSNMRAGTYEQLLQSVCLSIVPP